MTNEPDKTSGSGPGRETSDAISAPVSQVGNQALIAGEGLSQAKRAPRTRNRAKGEASKVALTSLVQLIERAYKQKGRKISLKPKEERAVTQALLLSEESLRRLAELASADVAFAVPRQLLLLAQVVSAGSGLRASLRAFVETRLQENPLLAAPHFDAAMRNLDEAPSPVAFLAEIAAFKRSQFKDEYIRKMKDAEFGRLKANTVRCLAVCLADIKGLEASAIARVLHLAVWSPEAQSLSNRAAQLRALTDIEDLVGVGVACQTFAKLAEEKELVALSSAKEVTGLRLRVDFLQHQAEALTRQIEDTSLVWNQERSQLEAQLSEAKQSAINEATHLRNDFKILRTRVVRSLKSDLTLLESGLEALRRPTPKVAVMEDFIERVTDSLRREIENAQGES